VPRRLLAFTRHTPLPWEDGAGAYLFDVLSYLRARDWKIDLVWFTPHDHLRWQGLWTLPRSFTQVARLHVPGGWRLGRHCFFPAIYWLPFKARAAHRVKSLLPRRARRSPVSTAAAVAPPAPPRRWMDGPNAAERAFAEHCIRRLRPDAVLSNYAWIAPVVPARPRFRHLCLHPDVAWQRATLHARTTGEPPELTPAQEAAFLQHAAAVAAISAHDAAALQALLVDRPVLVAPKAVFPHPQPASDQPRLLFVGSGNAFNAEGLRWFLREVWPALHAARPDVTLSVCGTIDRAVAERPSAVSFHGPVADLSPHYAAAAVVIVPLLSATGLNIKLVDAAAHRRAIVTTPATLAGAPFLVPTVVAAENPAEFAAAILRLLTDSGERERLAERAFTAVQTHLGADRCYGPLAEWLERPTATGDQANQPAPALPR
jgi:glycosyltransferase involved in cell wall biosynthesis